MTGAEKTITYRVRTDKQDIQAFRLRERERKRKSYVKTSDLSSDELMERHRKIREAWRY